MKQISPIIGRILAAACGAVMIIGVAPSPAGAAGDRADTQVTIPAQREVRLIDGPGVKPRSSMASPNSEQWVGKAWQGRPLVSRLFYSFDLSGLPADAITEVRLDNWQYFSPNRKCLLDSYGPDVEVAVTKPMPAQPRWPGPRPVSKAATSGFAVGSHKSCIPNRDQSWDVTQMVRDAARTSGTVWLRLASADETDRRGYRAYSTDLNGSPSLTVFVRANPDQPTHLSVMTPVPRSPVSPQVVAEQYTTVTAHLTTPGGCPNVTGYGYCLRARYEVRDGAGTVVDSGTSDAPSDYDGYAKAFINIGPLAEAEDYTVRVWAVNTETGLESLQPAAIAVRYDPGPTVPTVDLASTWALNTPVQMTVTTLDSDVEQACWSFYTSADEVLEGCTAIQPGVPEVITIGQFDEMTTLLGSVHVVDHYGTPGPTVTQLQAIIW